MGLARLLAGPAPLARGNQPVYYYALMSPLYEYLPLLLTLGGALVIALRGDS